MNRFGGRLAAIVFATVFCMGIFTGCSKKEEPVEPDPYEDEYYEDEYYEDEYYEDEDYVEEEPYEEESEDTSSESTDLVTGKWYTDGYDETDNWAGSYCLELKEDGTATCEGYRNRDSGKYEVKGDGKVFITFDLCETDEPDAGWVAVEGYSYTIDMKIDGDEATIKIDAPDVISNLEDGTLYREKGAGTGSEDGPDRSAKGKAKDGATIMFKTLDFKGNRVTSEEIFSKHEVTMVNVWATWCHWCIAELPELEELNKKLADKDCAIVGLLGDVDDDSTVDEAIEILEDNDVTYLNILPWDGATEKDFNMDEGWPTTFFVGRDGKIIGDPIVGADIDAYEKRIDEILKDK